MIPAHPQHWWQGAHGEWFLVGQVLLGGLIVCGPRTVCGLPAWPEALGPAGQVAGAVLLLAGGGLFLAGLLRLGRGLTPLPYPKEGASLIMAGPYALVRHPLYSALLALGSGWALFVQGWLTLAYTAALFVLLDLKSRREERWLEERFPAYREYRQRVRRFIPFLY